jgi:uncharacterized protein (TIGR00251 family)
MIIKVKVHPNSKERKIQKNDDGWFQVYINQKPIKGEANKELLMFLSEYFGIKTNQIFLISGIRSREKIFEVMFS